MSAADLDTLVANLMRDWKTGSKTSYEVVEALFFNLSSTPFIGSQAPVQKEPPIDKSQVKRMATQMGWTPPVQGEPSSCNWAPDADNWENGVWHSSCGDAWIFIEGGPAENQVKFCQGCGKPVAIDAARKGKP